MDAIGRGHSNENRSGAARPGERAGELERELVKLQPCLRARAYFLTQGSATADDLVQDVMERALLSRHRFQSGTNLKAWLCSIMRNLFIDGYRQRRTRELRDLQLEPPEPAEEEGPLDLLAVDDVLEAVARLRPSDREIFELAHTQHLSYREISIRLGIPTNTTGTRLHRVRNKLRQILTRVYDDRRART